MRVMSILAVTASLVAQQPARPVPGQPPRDVVRRPMPPDPVGTASIRGRVLAADTGSPIRRASVMLMGVPPASVIGGSGSGGTGALVGSVSSGVVGGIVGGVSVSAGPPSTVVLNSQMMTFVGRPKTTTTDSQGLFEFRDLPAGSYRLRVSSGQYSAQYLGMTYGAKKPDGPGSFDQGQPIELTDGQTFDKATIALPRGSVIAGRVTDENGEPLARVQVYTMLFPAGSSRGMRMGGGSSTDDLGQFRLWGLSPGDYVVVAEARGNTFVPPDAPPEKEEDRTGFLTTYYPGTPDESAAQRVRVKAGGETQGIEVRLVSGRLFHISGMVVDSQGAGARMMGMLLHRAAGGGANSFGFSSDDQGRFQMRSIPPGEYRLILRPQPQRPNADGSQPQVGEYANMPISLTSDLDNILVTTTPGVTITGQIVFENGPPQLPPGQSSFQMRVNASIADPTGSMGLPPPQPVLVNPDLTFTMKGLMGEYLLRTFAPRQNLKAVLLGGTEDISDTPREFKNGDRVTLVLTSRAATVEGTVTDAAGKPATETSIVMFSDDKAAWRINALRTRRGFTDANGHYKIMGVLPGRYYVIAVPRERLIGPQDAAYFEQLAKDATSAVVTEDEQRTVDLKVSTPGGEQ